MNIGALGGDLVSRLINFASERPSKEYRREQYQECLPDVSWIFKINTKQRKRNLNNTKKKKNHSYLESGVPSMLNFTGRDWLEERRSFFTVALRDLSGRLNSKRIESHEMGEKGMRSFLNLP